MVSTAATAQLAALYGAYQRVLPKWTFPYVTLGVAAVFQSFAWMSGPIFLGHLTLLPRILVLWMFAAGEYLFMSPTMNIGVEVLGLEEPLLVVIYQVMTLIIFMIIDVFVFKNRFRAKHVVAFALLAITIYIVYMW